jgi:hypothetical protein
MEFFDSGPSSSQFTIDDYDFSVAYSDYKQTRSYVASKVGFLKGNSMQEDPNQFHRQPDDFIPNSRSVRQFRGHDIAPNPDKIETTNLHEVFGVKEIKQLGSFRASILEEALRFLRDISENGVNGHRVGAIMVIGPIPDLVAHSTGEIPNPLKGHTRESRSIFKGSFKNSLAQFSQFDGFIGMDWDGCVEFCGRLIETPRELGTVPIEILGHGARHKAGWSISKLVPGCISLVLSQDGEILIIQDGTILKKVITMNVTERIVTYNSRSIESYLDNFDPKNRGPDKKPEEDK